jgi:two-component system OmpR family response regulator
MCVQSESRTILVVEDDADIRRSYEELLKDAGYSVLSAASGQQARALATRQPVAAVLLNDRLSDTTGVELCREFRAHLALTIPIIVLTADRTPTLAEAATTSGATALLHKPIDPYDLLTLLAAYRLR